jgi:hypothetical protein
MINRGILGLTALLIAFRPAASQQTCHGADANSDLFIKSLIALMDSSHSATRAKLRLPTVNTSAIKLVTNGSVCARAGLAADSIFKVWEPTAVLGPTTDPIYVIRVGASYAVADLNSPDDSDGDWVFIFGPLWEYRGSVIAR